VLRHPAPREFESLSEHCRIPRKQPGNDFTLFQGEGQTALRPCVRQPIV
jgi:hypothetical protein